MAEQIIWLEEYSVGHEEMDAVHQAFLELLSSTLELNGEDFDKAFFLLIEHTKEHFAFEERQMENVKLSSRREHMDEHQRICSEMDYFYEKALRGRRSYARAYLCDQLPRWLRNHTATMDVDLARCIQLNSQR